MSEVLKSNQSQFSYPQIQYKSQVSELVQIDSLIPHSSLKSQVHKFTSSSPKSFNQIIVKSEVLELGAS